jgi:hypothetical protein
MFNDQPAGPLESLTVMADENGRPSMVLARHGNAISFSVLNVGTAFRSRASVNLKGGKEDRVGEALATDRTTITIKNDKSVNGGQDRYRMRRRVSRLPGLTVGVVTDLV